VNAADAVEADTDVREPSGDDASGGVAVDARPVGREDAAQSTVARVGNELEEVGSHQGLAAGEQHRGHTVGGEVVQQGSPRSRRQLVLVLSVLGIRVAVHAVQVAAAGDVPDDDRLLVGGEMKQVRGQAR
jgi:hypothetical protein